MDTRAITAGTGGTTRRIATAGITGGTVATAATGSGGVATTVTAIRVAADITGPIGRRSGIIATGKEETGGEVETATINIAGTREAGKKIGSGNATTDKRFLSSLGPVARKCSWAFLNS